MARILTFMPWAIYTPHLETDLELVQLALDAGDTVDLIECNADLAACDRNPTHSQIKCWYCRGKREYGLGLLEGSVRRLRLPCLEPRDVEELRALRTCFDSVEDLRAFHVDAFDLGYAALASLVSYYRDTDFSSPARAAWLAHTLEASLCVYRSVQNLIDRHGYDLGQIFNGRFAICRAFRRACESRGVDYVVHERGSEYARYATYRNTTSHDLDDQRRRMLAKWEADAGDPEREAQARRFYIDRSEGTEKRWMSHVGRQQAGQLPEGWSDADENVVIFLSSEDEVIAIGEEWRNPLYENQIEGIRRLCASFAGESGMRFWLRVHPNLRDVDNDQTREIEALRGTELGIIDADSTVSTYALLRSATKVVSFGSTVGIEATYWGTPSILAGQCLYRELGGTYNPADHAELVALVRRPLAPLPVEAALIYGYYWHTFGEPFRYFEATGVFAGRFRGARVRPRLPELAIAALLRACRPLDRRASRRSLARLRARMFDGATGDERP